MAPYSARQSLGAFPAALPAHISHQNIGARVETVGSVGMTEQNLMNHFAAQLATPGLWDFPGADMVPRLIAECFELSFEIDCGYPARQRFGTTEPILEGTLLRRDNHYRVAYRGEFFDPPKDGDCLLQAVLMLYNLQFPAYYQAFNFYRAISAGLIPSRVMARYPYLPSFTEANIALSQRLNATTRQEMRTQLAHFVLTRMSGETKGALLEAMRGDNYQIAMQRQTKPAIQRKIRLHHDGVSLGTNHKSKKLVKSLSLLKKWAATSTVEKAHTRFSEFVRQHDSLVTRMDRYIDRNGTLTLLGRQRLAHSDGTRVFRKCTDEDILGWLKQKQDGCDEIIQSYADRHNLYACSFYYSVRRYLKKHPND